ncbi:MAG: hypothetical protein EA366_04810 [Spirulina sp. DLM2.Bin59]|nr:MAG: hypothetical protein EA366_04810 [Spirulina sp. DLM2.Bin59]
MLRNVNNGFRKTQGLRKNQGLSLVFVTQLYINSVYPLLQSRSPPRCGSHQKVGFPFCDLWKISQFLGKTSGKAVETVGIPLGKSFLKNKNYKVESLLSLHQLCQFW